MNIIDNRNKVEVVKEGYILKSNNSYLMIIMYEEGMFGLLDLSSGVVHSGSYTTVKKLLEHYNFYDEIISDNMVDLVIKG